MHTKLTSLCLAAVVTTFRAIILFGHGIRINHFVISWDPCSIDELKITDTQNCIKQFIRYTILCFPYMYSRCQYYFVPSTLTTPSCVTYYRTQKKWKLMCSLRWKTPPCLHVSKSFLPDRSHNILALFSENSFSSSYPAYSMKL